HRRAEHFQRQHRPYNRRSAIGGNQKMRPQLLAPYEANARRPALLFDEALDWRFHLQVEARKGLCLLAQEVEEIPLRHHGDEWRWRIEMRQVADLPLAPGNPELGRVQFTVRPLQEPPEHPQLVEDFHR